MRRAAVITLSDRGAAGLRDDTSGPSLAKGLSALGFAVRGVEILPDETDLLAARLEALADDGETDLIVTTGGTGLSPRDATPPAFARVCDRLLPAVSERLTADGLAFTPMASLSRSLAGMRGSTVMCALPGSPKAVNEGLDILKPFFALIAQTLTTGGQPCIER